MNRAIVVQEEKLLIEVSNFLLFFHSLKIYFLLKEECISSSVKESRKSLRHILLSFVYYSLDI